MIKKVEPSIMSGLRVGVLFNFPVMPSRGESADFLADAEVEEEVEAVEDALGNLGLQHQRFPLRESVESFVAALKSYRPDVVINLCEGAFGDSHFEMNVSSLLELLKLPYTGSPPLALGLCQDKGLTKDVLNARGISTPRYQVLDRFEDWKGELCYPLLVKPLREDSSIGISKESFVKDDAALKRRVDYVVERYRQPVLLEQYIAGRELNVALLGDTKIEALPISEIVFTLPNEPKIVDYAAKWLKESEEYKQTVPVCPADLDSSTRTLVEQQAVQAYTALHCRDYARIDIRLDGKIPYVLEANPNPDISLESGFVRSLKAAGISYEEFIQRIIHSAQHRG